MIDPAHVEAIVVTREPRAPQAERWFAERGLQPRSMRAGLLLTGARAAFEKAFGIDLGDVEPPVRIEVPPELRGEALSITIPPPRSVGPS